jgi:hypothetical protein
MPAVPHVSLAVEADDGQDILGSVGGVGDVQGEATCNETPESRSRRRGPKKLSERTPYIIYSSKYNINLLRRLVARMGASHAPGRGSIPRGGNVFLPS